MKNIWIGTLAMLVLAFAPLQATAQEAASSLNGIWLNEDSEALAFLTIIHKDNGQLAIISTNYVNLLGLVEGFQSAASLGQADSSALGENVGTAVSFPAVFFGAELQFLLHRPSADELMIEMTSCSVPEGNTVTCDLIEMNNFPLNTRLRHTRAF